ncbi:rhomboid family intramembrane serine protease [Flavobacteriaceae bacterium]|nr:rhomboid family intramembrane serine protease [Flavobacteriaceae bacterium]MDB4118199.1 rhomboid family intramembrane serine protease [Flavobacteriaceae bacterium]
MNSIQRLINRFYQFNIAEKIILINVICFVLPFFIKTLLFLFNLPKHTFFSWFELSPHPSTFIFQPWTLISYGFLHGSFGHILWNMLLLYYAAQFFLNLFSPKRFLNVYFSGIIAGGVVFMLSYALFPVFEGHYPSLVGASAGVMAVLIFSCTYMPNQEIRLLFFNVKLMYLGIGLVVLDVLQIPTGNAGGHIAHIGGAALGFLYASQLQKGNDIGRGFDWVIESITAMFKPKKTMETVHKAKRKSRQPSYVKSQKEIDTILDKISDSGYESLSKEEKELLFKAGKN